MHVTIDCEQSSKKDQTQQIVMFTVSDSYQRELNRFLDSSENHNKCGECGLPNPTWCSTTYNLFLCTRCATVHKKILNHDPDLSIIKSIKLDYWTNDELNKFINSGGNAYNKRFWNPKDIKNFDDANWENFLRDKYILKKFRYEQERTERNRISSRLGGTNKLLTGRMAKDYELSKYSRQLRSLKDMGFNDVDNNVEALNICNGNINKTINILTSNERSASAEPLPPSLPSRPQISTEPKPAIFDGSSPFASDDTSSSIRQNGPKPAVFDGSAIFQPQWNDQLSTPNGFTGQNQNMAPSNYSQPPIQSTGQIPGQSNGFTTMQSYPDPNLTGSQQTFQPQAQNQLQYQQQPLQTSGGYQGQLQQPQQFDSSSMNSQAQRQSNISNMFVSQPQSMPYNPQQFQYQQSQFDSNVPSQTQPSIAPSAVNATTIPYGQLPQAQYSQYQQQYQQQYSQQYPQQNSSQQYQQFP